jgi:predicted RNA binding protein YcfA (HicA-like mRNA interferase family)
MPKVGAITPQKIIKVLVKRGFVLDRTRGSHRIYHNPETKRRVVVPFHKKNLPKGTALAILKQAGIDREELEDLL